MTRRAFGLSTAAIGSFAILRHARGEDALKIRCSLDTAPSHIRNVSVVDYLGKVEKASGGKITSEMFHSGQLFPDLNVAKALLQGQIEMAVSRHLDADRHRAGRRFLPVAGVLRPADRHHPCRHRRQARRAGEQADRDQAARAGARPWIDLGFQNWYTTKTALHSADDLKGLKIRSPGGAGISWRIAFFGGIPNTTAWPNVPLALSQGTFDGFVSTNESVATAKLWEAGVKYSYQDHQYVGQYMPLITDAFWAKLTPDLQKMMRTPGRQNIPTYRGNALASQERARKLLADNGVTFIDPSDATLDAARKAMQADVASLITRRQAVARDRQAG